MKTYKKMCTSVLHTVSGKSVLYEAVCLEIAIVNG